MTPLIEALPFEMLDHRRRRHRHLRDVQQHARRETHARRLRQDPEGGGVQEERIMSSCSACCISSSASPAPRATWRWSRISRNPPTVPPSRNSRRSCRTIIASAMICDYLRMVGMNADDPNQIEDVMARELKKTLNEELHSAHALQTMADGLPALGIVAAVLGVIKTMSHIERAAGGAGRDDRRRAGRHLPRRAAGLRHGGAVRLAPEGGDRGGERNTMK